MNESLLLPRRSKILHLPDRGIRIPDARKRNLIIQNPGGLGDTGFMIPALNYARNQYATIWMVCNWQGEAVLGNTGLVDHFIVKPEGFRDWEPDRMRKWLTEQAQDMQFHVRWAVAGCIAGRYIFHEIDEQSKLPKKTKMAINAGVNYFDETSKWLGVPEAIGERPVTRILDSEEEWLAGFRERHGIPPDAFLLGWQFTSSSKLREYPHFDRVVQKGIMAKYPEVFVVALGDLGAQYIWDKS